MYSEFATSNYGVTYALEHGGNSETLLQPDEYDEAKSVEEFEIEDVDEDYHGILKKYQKLIDSFIEYRGDIETFLDNNGNEWMRTTLSKPDAVEPVISFQIEPSLMFESNGETFSSYGDALSTGREIKTGIETKDGFKPLITIPYNIDPSNVNGLINLLIKGGVMKDSKVIYKGDSYFVAEGDNYIEQKVNEDIIKDDLKRNVGSGNYTAKGGLISVEPVDSSMKEDSNHKLIRESLAQEILSTKGETVPKSQPNKIDKEDLKLKLLSILNKLGVETMSISNYLDKYASKNGVEPSANALADIANRVVAFKDGLLNIEDLTEETMHFIVEALPTETTANLLRNIDKSEEYSEYADSYRNVYASNNPGKTAQEIDEMVRKEILGKVMKNATLGRVNQPTQINFFRKAIEFIKEFFDSIVNSNTYKQQLKEVNRLLDQVLVEENLDPSNLENVDFVLYNIDNRVSDDTDLNLLRSINKQLLATLKQGYSSIKRGGGSLYSDKVKLGQYEDRIDEVSQAAAAADFLALIQRQVQYVSNALNASQRDSSPLSIESKNVLLNLKSGVRNLLEQQRKITEIKKPSELGLEKNSQKDVLLRKIDETILSISDISGRFNNLDTNSYKKIVDRIMQRHNLPESYRDFAESQAALMKTEVGFFMETFGQLTHSSDALLNMTGQVIEEMYGKHAGQVQKRFRNFTKVMEENGVDAEQLSKLFDNGYLLSKYDFKKFNDKLNIVDLNLYNKTFGENLALDQFVELKRKGGLKSYNASQQLIVNKERQERLSDFVERRMNDDYYKDKAKKYEELGISQDTIKMLTSISIERAILQNQVLDESGRPIYTEDEKAQLDSLSQLRKENKSFVNSIGVLKPGLIEQTMEEASMEGRYIEKGGLIYTLSENASKEARIAFELHLIDQSYMDSSDERSKDIDSFKLKILEASENSIEEALDFVKNNLGITFSSEFWNNTLSSENILDNPQVNEIESNKVYIKEIRQKRNALSQLKKLYQDHRNPVEILGDQMNDSEQSSIKQLVEEIELLTQKIVIPEGVELNKGIESGVVSGVNRAYGNELKLNGIEKGTTQEFDFIKKHISEKNSAYLRSLENDVKKLDNGDTANVSQRTMDRLEENRENGETYYQAFLNIARQRVLPYYKRYTPETYITLDELLEEGTDREKVNNLIEYITQIEHDPNYDFNVHHTFRAGEDMAVNSNYDVNFKGGFYQPSLSQFANEKYIETFAPDSNGVPTINQGLFNTLKALEELQEQNLEDVGLAGTQNLYQLPQISRTRINQVIDALSKSNKGKTFKEILKDTFKYRIDDLEYGAEENGVDILKATDARIVPTFYTKKLEEESDLSDDLFYSYLAMTNQSILHKLRREGLSDVMALEDKMINRVAPDGKTIQSTRNYKMMKSAIDYNFFGRKETRKFKANLPIFGEVDFTKVLRTINNYVKFRNLGLNVIVPFTSAITGEMNLQIEGVIGEYISRDALKLASKEFAKLAPEATNTKNSLAYNDKSKLNVLGEFLQVYDMSDKAANSKYPTLMRWMPKVGMILHQMGNFPIIPRVFLSVLFDNRVVNGKLISKRDFINANKASSKPMSKKELNAEWKKYENDTIYNYLNITEEGIEYKPELLEKLDGDTEYLENKMQRIKSLVKDQIQKIDGQIPESQKVQAQRDAVFNYFMTHRGWLSIATQRRFKSAQYNIETGQLEEGSYVTMKNLVFDMFGNIGTGEDKTWNLIKAFKQAMNGKGRLAEKLGIEPNQQMTNEERELIQRNLKRIGVEFVFMTGIVSLVAMVSAMADDEDNEDLYALQLSNYFLYRLANETSSTQLGIFGQFSDVIKSPFVGYQQVLDAANVSQAFDTEEITRGTYKGHTKAYKYFFKSTPGLKGLHDLTNIRNTSDTYRYYQGQSINQGSLGLYSLLSGEE
jgi:hypothetical protein